LSTPESDFLNGPRVYVFSELSYKLFYKVKEIAKVRVITTTKQFRNHYNVNDFQYVSRLYKFTQI